MRLLSVGGQSQVLKSIVIANPIAVIYFETAWNLTMAVYPSQSTRYVDFVVEFDLAIAVSIDTTCRQPRLGAKTSLFPLEHSSEGVVVKISA